jgi:hypothetical protein
LLPPNVLRISRRRGARHNMASKNQRSRAEGGQLQALFAGSRFMAFECDLSRFSVEPHDWSLP